jgi:16S rRNA G966 N2-methylase RsmD
MAKKQSAETESERGVHAASTSESDPGLKRAKASAPSTPARPSALVDTRVIYCGDNLEQLQKLPDACVDLIYIDPPFNSDRNFEDFWGETKEKRAFEGRHGNNPVLCSSFL